MKRLLYSAVATVLFFASCAENEEVVQSNILPSGDFVAMFDEATRTELDGSSVVWHENDQLTIFTNTSHNRQYKIKTLTEDGRTATFGYVGYTGSDNTEIETNYAVYPYNADATLSNGVVTTVLEASQSYNTTNGGLCYALMSAASEDNNFAFVNSGALMRFKVSNILPDEFTLNSIHLTSANHKLAGEVTINLNGDKMAVVTENGVNSITLADINCKVTSEVQEFYVALPATTFDENDLVVVFEFAEGNKEFTLPAFELKQGKIKTISYSIADAEDFTGNTPGEEPKPANNEIWYTSEYDVTLEFDENDFDANIVSHTYVGGKYVITFDADLTTIGFAAFYYCESLTSVNIPDSVTTIGGFAFAYCRSLTSVTIPDSVTTIGDDAFLSCSSLKSVTIPDSVTTIGYEAFKYCSSLTSVTIPDSVTTIGDYAFFGCSSLTSITIPDSVTTIGEGAFADCINLVEFNGKFASEDGRCLIVDGTLNSFAPAGLTSYTIPDSVTTIGDWAFYECGSLTSVTIGDSVTTIGDDAFRYCSSLTEFNGKFASEDGRCLIVDGTLNSFAPAGLTSYTIPDSVMTIGNSAFEYCDSLTSVTIPDSVTTIGDYAFSWCSSLTGITISDSVTTIGEGAFVYCDSLTSVTIPDSVTTIGDIAFQNCASLTSVTIGDSVTTIGNEAFEYCYSLTSVNIPDSVTTIGAGAFYACTSLTSVYCKATTPPSLGSGDVFNYNGSGHKIYVPTASVDAYKSAEYWRMYASAIEGYDFDKGEVVE